MIEACGFEGTGTCPASELRVRSEVRDMCSSDKCKSYGKSWACPPGCGPIEEYQKLIDAASVCHVVQTVAQLEDDFDIETMMEAAKLQDERCEKLRALLAEHAPQARLLASGTCMICPECTYPDAPCRFPELRLVSMEAAGLVVSDVCTLAGVPYNHGPSTMAYTGCILV